MATQPVDDSTSELDPAERSWYRRENLVRFLKFGLVGGLGVFVNWAFFEVGFWAFSSWGDDPAYLGGLILGLLVSIFTNFVLNDVWTWADRVKGGIRHWFHRLFKYYVSALVAGAIQVAVSWWSLELLFSKLALEVPSLQIPIVGATIPAFDAAPRLGLFAGIACGMVVNFLAGHFWAFRDAEES